MRRVRVFLSNLGCKLNQAELESLAREFLAAGHDLAPALEAADLHVVNTCSVTHRAARDSRKLARRGGRRNAGLRTVLTGCYVASDPDEAAQLAGVDLVVPNDRKHELVEEVHRAFPGTVPAPARRRALPYMPIEFGNSRALVKIEDGCDMRCAFCIIPSTRGSQRSRPADTVVDEVRRLEAGGFREIIVTGVQISSYRDGDRRLVDLTRRLLRETEGARLRLTSIAPWQFDPRLLGLLSHPRICRHVHLSLQSGCAATLVRMRRPYSPRQFAELCDRIRDAAPGAAITTDLIVGFPGETETEFEQSLAFVEARRFARVHAFPYSSRPGTEAALFPDPVESPVIRERMRRALETAERAARDFRTEQRGRRAEVLWESRRQGRWIGTTDNYLRVALASERSLEHHLTPVVLGEPLEGDLSRASFAPTASPAQPIGATA